MNKRIGKRKGRGVQVDIPDAAIDAALTGVEVLGGFMAAEALSNAAKTAFTNEAGISKITTNVSALIKGAGAIATGVLAFTKMGRKYQSHLLTFSGGMAANAVATGFKAQLPAELQALVPSVGRFTQLPPVTRRGIQTPGNRRLAAA